jgi:hypothetical protein
MQEKKEFLENFSNILEKERAFLHYSQSEMARALDISLSSYKRIVNRENCKVDLYTVYRMQQLTGKLMDELCQIPSPLTKSLSLLRQLSARQLRFVHSVLEFEICFARSLHSDSALEDFVTLIIPSGNMHDGMIFDSCNLDKINIASYRPRFGKTIDCALLITSNHLQPVYQRNDILLLCLGPIRDGDTGIFIDNDTGLAYIRKFYQADPCRMEPLSGYVETFFLDCHCRTDIARWTTFGYVVTKMRT